MSTDIDYYNSSEFQKNLHEYAQNNFGLDCVSKKYIAYFSSII